MSARLPSIQKQQLVQTERLSRFTAWLFEQIRPFVQGIVWEAGCGIGTYTQLLLATGCERIIATDCDGALLAIARETFRGVDRVEVCDLDLSRADDYGKVQGVQTIVCLNVLEHIEDDAMVLREMYKLLPPRGKLLLLVPAHRWLFNGIDRSVHHHRRYTRSELSTKLQAAGFTRVRLHYFNALAIVGWYVYGHLLRRVSVPETPASGFDRLVPFMRWAERALLRERVGISLIAVAEREPI